MAKNIQRCANCGAELKETYRMQLMMGPKGYRNYAVCMEPCKKKVEKKPGICSLGYDMSKGGR